MKHKGAVMYRHLYTARITKSNYKRRDVLDIMYFHLGHNQTLQRVRQVKQFNYSNPLPPEKLEIPKITVGRVRKDIWSYRHKENIYTKAHRKTITERSRWSR